MIIDSRFSISATCCFILKLSFKKLSKSKLTAAFFEIDDVLDEIIEERVSDADVEDDERVSSSTVGADAKAKMLPLLSKSLSL